MNPLFSIEHLVLVLLGVLAAGVYAAWRTASRASSRVRGGIVLLRLVGLAALCVVALNPGRWREHREDVRNEWAVVVDRSQSMAVEDANGRSRWEEGVRLAKRAAALADDPANVKCFTFCSTLDAADLATLGDAEPARGSTDIVQSGRSLLGRYRKGSRRLRGILLLSDGRQVQDRRYEELGMEARARETPIYALALGGEVGRRDLSIRPARKQYVSFAGQELSVKAVLRNQGMGPVAPKVELLDSTGKVLDEKAVELENNAEKTVPFTVVSGETGYNEYSFRVQPWAGEGQAHNNEVSFGIVALASKLRVLLVEGTPYWDSKFVAQLLRNQPNIEVTGIYRVSSARFFRVESDATQVSDAETAIFPDDRESLSAYDLVVFGKGVEYFLNPDRIRLLRHFIREQGGCIIFSRSKPYAGEFPGLDALEPIGWGKALANEFRLGPTVAGEDSGLFGDVLPAAEDGVWQKLPPLRNAYRCARLKGFSQVLVEGVSTVGSREIRFPAVVSRRYGKGMVLVVNIEGLWRWGFFPTVPEANEVYGKLWPQLLEWSATYADFLPGFTYALRLSDKATLPDRPVRARVSRRGRDEQPRPQVLKVFHGGEMVQELALAEAGMDRWDAIFSLAKPGNYRVELVESESGKRTGPCAALRVMPLPGEGDEQSADHEWLRLLGESSGGGLVKEEELAALVETLEPEVETVDLHKAVWDPAWDRWWVLCAVALALGGECFIRRRNGLV